MIPVIAIAALAAGAASDAAREPDSIWDRPGFAKRLRAMGPKRPPPEPNRSPDWVEGEYGERKLRRLTWEKADAGDEVEILYIPEQDLWLPHFTVSGQVVTWEQALPIRQAQKEAIAGYHQQQYAQQRWKREEVKQ